MTTTATALFSDRIGRIEISATMAVTAEAAKLRAQGAEVDAQIGATRLLGDEPPGARDTAAQGK